MAQLYKYACRSCAYTADISGGRDINFTTKTQTGYCTVCQELTDYVTEVWDPRSVGDREIHVGACYTCKTPIQQDWNSGDPCPKCGGEFEMTGMSLHWI